MSTVNPYIALQEQLHLSIEFDGSYSYSNALTSIQAILGASILLICATFIVRYRKGHLSLYSFEMMDSRRVLKPSSVVVFLAGFALFAASKFKCDTQTESCTLIASGQDR